MKKQAIMNEVAN